MLGPAIARDTIGETAWGVVLSARAVGLLLMAVVMYRLVVRHLLRFGQLCAALLALPMVVLGLDVPAAWLVAAAFVAGLGSSVMAIAWETSLQEHVPRRSLSRVASYDELGSFAAVPLGQLAIVPIAAALGDRTVAMWGGVLFAALTLAALLSPAVRRLRHDPDRRTD